MADTLLNIRDVERATSLDHSTVYRLVAKGAFPSPLRIGVRRSAWRDSEITAWQDAQPRGVRTEA